jgi:thioredoxin 2
MAIYRCATCGAVNRIVTSAGDPACARCRFALDTTGAPQRVDSASLVSAIISSPAPVLVEFTSPDAAAAELEDVAGARAGELLWLRIDARTEPAAAAAYRVQLLPTLMLFSAGSEVGRLTAGGLADASRWVAQATVS